MISGGNTVMGTSAINALRESRLSTCITYLRIGIDFMAVILEVVRITAQGEVSYHSSINVPARVPNH